MKVNYSHPGLPNWNQIHIVGTIPEKEKDPTAANAAGATAIRQVIPGNVDFAAVKAAVHSIATHSRDDRARELFELAVR